MRLLIISSPLLALLSISAVAAAPTPSTISPVVEYEVTNNAIGTPGDDRFDSDIGVDYTKKVLSEATSFIWAIFEQQNDHKNVKLITSLIENMDGLAAYTAKDVIHLNTHYIENFSGNVREEITGLLYPETTHVWQWNGQNQAPLGLIEGVADYVRLKAGYEPLGRWRKPGQGDRWDQGYDVTARFLDYCGGLDTGFVGKLNAKMKNGYSDDFFVDLLGKSVDQLFSHYMASFVSTTPVGKNIG